MSRIKDNNCQPVDAKVVIKLCMVNEYAREVSCSRFLNPKRGR